MLMSASRRSTSSPALRTRRLDMSAPPRTGWGATSRTLRLRATHRHLPPPPRPRRTRLLRSPRARRLMRCLQPALPARPPLVYISIPVDTFTPDIRVKARRVLFLLAPALMVLLLLSQPARATSPQTHTS